MHETMTSAAAESQRKRALLKELLRSQGAGPKQVPLSFTQERLWLIDQIARESAAYCESGAFRLRSRINLDLVQQALDDVVRRHEPLRTTFTNDQGRPTAVVAESLSVPIELQDVRDLPATGRDARVRELIQAQARRPFELDRGPLFRCTVFRCADDDYVIAFTMHHILADGWSMRILSRDLASRYLVRAAGVPDQLPALTATYADFVRWQRAQFAAGAWDESLAYWRKKLAGVELLELPTDRPRPAMPSFHGRKLSFVLPPSLTAALRQLARSQGVTLYMTLLAAFEVLLFRYSGQDDFAVGSPVANRNRAEYEQLIGLTANVITLRSDVAENPSFIDLLQRVRQTVVDAFRHQELPFEKLVADQQSASGQGAHPYFRVAFAFFRNLTEMMLAPSLRTETVEVDPETAKQDLALFVWEGDDELEASWEYATALFDADTIARLHTHFYRLLEAIVANPGRPIRSLPMLTDAERTTLLTDWRGTTEPYPDDCGIHQLIEAQARRVPDAIALESPDVRVTYREFNARANRLARFLRGRGVERGRRVAICLDRGCEVIISILAVLKAGAAYVPLDPDYPPQRLEFLVSDSQPDWLITDAAHAERFPSHAERRLLIEEIEAEVLRQPDENLDWTGNPDDLAYLVYTSGSTGQPKGVMIRHGGVCHLATAHNRRFPAQSDDGILQFASVCFDASVWEIFPPLTAGIRLCLASREELLPGPPLQQTLERLRVTMATLAPSALAVLPSEGLPRLTTVVSAGEACNPELIARWSQGRRFVNGYGPTENTVCITLHECNGKVERVSIGRPIPNVEVFVFDAGRELVPVGAPGELYVGGAGLAKGYWNRPELTEQRFVPHPFRDDGSKLYRTGDLVRWLPDGTLEFLGRVDRQVKIRGFRIELGEIEATLSRHPGVANCAVIVATAASGDKRLAAYAVLHAAAPATSTDDLLRFLQSQLPPHHVPASIVIMPSFPLLPNGKVNLRELPIPEAFHRQSAALVPPRTDEERRIAAIWQSLLQLDRVGVTDSFFDVGGHSLLATQVIAALEREFHIQIPLQTLWTHPTIAGQAEVVRDISQHGSTAGTEPADPHADTALDPAISAPPGGRAVAAKPKRILLTGASGFLGAYLLRELLVQTTADIYCLVRADDEAHAAKKLRRTLEAYDLFDEETAARIIPLLGDLSLPRLGLAPAKFAELADAIDVVYHNGAWVNFLFPYSSLRASNVLGTQEVLRLAATNRVKPVHYVSTLSVFPTLGFTRRILEDEEPAAHPLPDGGYAQTKWVAEHLVLEAGRRGIPVSLYRPGQITGDSRSGNANPDDLFSRMLSGMIQWGRAPDLDREFNVTPVDYVGRAIVHLSRQPASLGKSFHLHNPQPISWNAMMGALRSAGYPIQTQGLEEWMQQALNGEAFPTDNPLAPMLPLVAMKLSQLDLSAAADAGFQLAGPEFDCRQTLATLAGSGIECPRADENLFASYVAYLQRIGRLAPAASAGALTVS